ncbi:hypothetical protein ABGB16_02095 [Micromonospora sp. B11E3]
MPTPSRDGGAAGRAYGASGDTAPVLTAGGALAVPVGGVAG